jgi:2-dehydro-3-deoxygluconokinase
MSRTSQRASNVIYDRGHSATSEIQPGVVPWHDVFEGAAWFHCTGITPAVSQSARDCTREALQAAKRAGVRISIDLNFRAEGYWPGPLGYNNRVLVLS